jgi:SAM-dependent methyltransferase
MPADTRDTFRDKWRNNPDAVFDATLREGSTVQRWILERNGLHSASQLTDLLRGRRRILDAGCGNGRVTALLARHAQDEAEVWGIDFAAADVAAANLRGFPRVRVAAKDILDDLSDLGSFDFIYCQEVLHHTDDPRRGFTNLSGRLVPGGEIAIYVYKLKAPVREFTDDYLRAKMAKLSYDEAMELARTVTELGRRLSAIGAEIDAPAIEALGIPGGRHPLQRFLYHFFIKCFWNDELSFDENAVINFDWYRPQIASRHTLEEVRGWFRENGLALLHEHVDEYGITVRGVRPKEPA